MRAAAVGLLALAACAGASRERPLWERPGYEGVVRPEWGPPSAGDPAPDFALPRTSGGTFRLASARGSWVVLHFTATWCPFCDEEVASFGEISRAFEGRDVRVVLVAVKEDPAVWGPYVADYQLPSSLEVLEDRTGDAARRYAPAHVTPAFRDRSQVMLASTVIVDPEGKIRLQIMPDSVRFDPTLRVIREQLHEYLGDGEVVAATPAAPAAASAEAPAAEAPELLAPEDVVRIESPSPSGVGRGGSSALVLVLHIAPGYHVMSDRPSRPEFIATQVRLAPSAGLAFGAPAFPGPVPFHLVDEDIATFQGDVRVSVPLTVAGDAAMGARRLTGTVRYQACTRTTCLFPVDRPIEVPLAISPGATEP